MALLTTAEKADLTADIEQVWNDTCSILQWAKGSDGYTDGKDTWPTTVNNVPCGFKPKVQKDVNTGAISYISGQAELRLSLTQAVSAKDKIVVRGATWLIDGQPINGMTVKLLSLKQADPE